MQLTLDGIYVLYFGSHWNRKRRYIWYITNKEYVSDKDNRCIYTYEGGIFI